MKDELRIIFIGTPEFAVYSLQKLIEADKNVVAVITAPDRKAGRGQKLTESAVKAYAIKQNIPVLQPTNLKSQEFVHELEQFNANLQIVVAFRMLPEVVWNKPQYGTFNLHASLLPQYRGAAPINWVIINGEKNTGVTTFFLKHKIDTGDLILQKSIEIEDRETAGSLHDKLMKMGGELVLETVNKLEKEEVHTISQNLNLAIKEAPKLTKENTKIDWQKTKDQIDRLIRGLSPYPAAWCFIKQKETSKKYLLKFFNCEINEQNHPLKAGEIAQLDGNLYFGCSNGALKITELQLEGKKRMSALSLMNGFNLEDYEAC